MVMLSKKSIILLILSLLFIVSFFSLKVLVMVDWIPCDSTVQWYEFGMSAIFTTLITITIYNILTTHKSDIMKRKVMEVILDESCLVSRADKGGKITDVNTKFCEVSGYKKHELLGQDHHILNSGKHPHDFWAKMYETTIIYKSIWHDTVINKTKDGDEYIVDSYIMATFDEAGKHDGYISVRQDITELMETLMDVDRKNAYLEHAAKILRHDMHSGINTYIPRGIKSLERRLSKLGCDDILSNIESPMRMLKEGLAHAQKVYNGVKEFTNLVKKDAVLHKESRDLQSTLRAFLKSTAYNSQVKIDSLGTASINEPLFCTAIDNLIRNGLKYNDSKTKYVKIYKEGNSLVVHDNGRGMTQDEFNEFSKPYTRKKDNKESGSGLGLNICVAIMREHGFDISCEKYDGGTKIMVKIQ